MAVTEAARQAKKAGVKRLKINTDSKFLIKCVTEWMKKWKVDGWKTAKKKPVINKEELIELESALSSLEVIWVSEIFLCLNLESLKFGIFEILHYPNLKECISNALIIKSIQICRH